MSHVAQVFDYLHLGPAHKNQIGPALGLTVKQVSSAITQLLASKSIEKVGEENVRGISRPMSIFALVDEDGSEEGPKPDASAVVASALALRTDLERAWM